MIAVIIVIMLSVCSGYKLPICLRCPGSALYGCKDQASKKPDQSANSVQMVS